MTAVAAEMMMMMMMKMIEWYENELENERKHG